MKNILPIISIIIISCFQVNAQKQPVPYYFKEKRSVEFYKEQRSLWEEETKIRPKNEKAWLYFFTANRALKTFDTDPQWEKAEQPILAKMEKKIPNSFTWNFCKGWSLGLNDDKCLGFLEKAYKMEPDNPLVYKDLAIQYEAITDLKKRKEINQICYNSSEVTTGLLNVTANLINGLEPNTILITFGDLDTYPIWILQDVKELRKDVTVCNIFMMRKKEYREKLFALKGIVLPKAESEAFADEFEKGFKRKWSEEESLSWNTRFIEAIYKHNPDRPLHVALSGNFKAMEDKLYITGLSSRYSDKNFENLASLRKNFEKIYMLDYLKMSFHPDPYQSFVDDFNMTYITSFLKLHKHYKDSGDNERMTEVREYIDILAKKSKYEKEINQWLTKD